MNKMHALICALSILVTAITLFAAVAQLPSGGRKYGFRAAIALTGMLLAFGSSALSEVVSRSTAFLLNQLSVDTTEDLVMSWADGTLTITGIIMVIAGFCAIVSGMALSDRSTTKPASASQK